MLFKGIVSKSDYEKWNSYPPNSSIADIYLHLKDNTTDESDEDYGLAEFLTKDQVKDIVDEVEDINDKWLLAEEYGIMCSEAMFESSGNQDASKWIKIKKTNINNDPDKILIVVRHPLDEG